MVNSTNESIITFFYYYSILFFITVCRIIFFRNLTVYDEETENKIYLKGTLHFVIAVFS